MFSFQATLLNLKADMKKTHFLMDFDYIVQLPNFFILNDGYFQNSINELNFLDAGK